MKTRLLLAALVLIAISVFTAPPPMRVRTAVAPKTGVQTATSFPDGVWTSGGTEYFEKGAGLYNCTGWTKTDTGSILSSFDTAQAVTGTHSMSVTQGATAGNAFIYQNQADDQASVRFYFRTTGWPSVNFTTVNLCVISEASSGANPLVIFQLRLASPNNIVRFSGATSDSLAVSLSANTWYRVEVDYARNASTTCKIYAIGGAQQGATLTVTANDKAGGYACFGNLSTAASFTNQIVFIDNIKFQSAGGAIGADE